VIRNPEVDIVYVATPPNAHLEYVLAAADAGKHVLVEKPMGLSTEQGQEMVSACESAGVSLFVAYYRRFHPHVQKMRELIRTNRIGTPVQAFIDMAADVSSWGKSWKETPKISGGGYFVDLVSHRIDAATFLLGSVKEVYGVTTTFHPEKHVEETASVCLKFASGTQCVVTGDFHSGRAADRFVISGTCGTLTADPLDGHAFSLHTDEGMEDFTFEKYPAPHLGLIRHIEQVCAGSAENESSGMHGLETERVLDTTVRCKVQSAMQANIPLQKETGHA
jgi:predicted dehydrogenase